LLILALTAMLWSGHILWLARDTRPPVWDMAMHQSYALNYLPGAPVPAGSHYWDLSGDYPPFVHIVIATTYMLLHPGPHVAVLANLPATLLLLWGIYRLGLILAGPGAARWACVLTALIPYLVWISRETILDYWLSAWVAVSLFFLLNSEGFESRSSSILFGVTSAFGLLTKWFFAGFLALPAAFIFMRHRVWKSQDRLINCADAVLIAAGLAGLWYVPNLPRLIHYFSANAGIGAREGEPPVFSLQSFIYYLRLLEGYQLFALLFVLAAFSCFFFWKKNLTFDRGYWLTLIAGGWLAMTLLRTKDPRFTMPLLGPLMIAAGSWLHSWGGDWRARCARWTLVALLGFQAYAINFGIGGIPRNIVLMPGYQGSLRWDWNLYLQDYFNILGAPRREDWRQDEILQEVVADSARRGLRPLLGLVPDLARFSAANFHLYARLRHLPVRVDHIQSAPNGLRSFDGFDYVVMTERDQGMPWSTVNSRALNQIIVDEHGVFRLVDVYSLPNGDAARLYWIQRGEKEGG
jgi:4-amino-4-deoxy-L-arabinose transferase-like glycosyltransferase